MINFKGTPIICKGFLVFARRAVRSRHIEQSRCKMDGMIQLQLLHQKKNVLPDGKCSLKLSDASVKAKELIANGNINAILLLFFGILQTG